MTRLEMLNQIKEDLENKLTIAHSYQVEPLRVVVGFPNPESINQFPTLCVYLVNDQIANEDMGGERERIATIIIIGYTNDSDSIYKLSEDLEKFFYSTDFTYSNDTLLNPEGPTFSIGGIAGSVGINMVDLQIFVNYTQEF